MKNLYYIINKGDINNFQTIFEKQIIRQKVFQDVSKNNNKKKEGKEN